MTVTEFLLARIAEDEAVARAATQEPWYTTYVPEMDGGPYGDWIVDSEKNLVSSGRCWDDRAKHDTAHIARHDPARVLAECAAKRALVELAGLIHDKITWEWGGCESWKEDGWVEDNEGTELIRTLAAVYASHPDYDETWKP